MKVGNLEITMETVKKLLPNSTIGQLTMSAVVVEAIIIVALESSIASIFLPQYELLKTTTLKGIPVYLMIFLFSQIFQVALCWDALFHQNTIQIIGFMLFNLCCFLYSIFQYSQINAALMDTAVASFTFNNASVNGQMIGIIVVTGLFELIYIYCGFKLYLEFGWKIYKKIGADPNMKNMYRAYQIFVMILKLDFFFFLAFSVQFVVLVLKAADPEFYLTIIALPVTVFVLFIAVYGLRNENKPIMSSFLGGTMLAIAYFTFKLVRMYDSQQEQKYTGVRNFLTFFATLSLAAVLFTTINAIVCFRNFGKGLKQHIATTKVAPPTTPLQMEDRKMSLVE